MRASITTAAATRLITDSGFSNYDACLNPYVGCEFGCSYCYVRFFVKDPHHDWGQFVRIRQHLATRLPKELDKGSIKLKHGGQSIGNTRLVIGTMTDPYQPAEKKHHITKTALQILTTHENQFRKVGIFTRSPLVLHDLELISQLPQARVHFTITPLPPDILRAIEPYSPITSRRWAVVTELKQAGLRVHVNISPIIPQLSEQYIEEFVAKLVELQIDEYFVDPMQPYTEAMQAMQQTYQHPNWPQIEQIMLHRNQYTEWQAQYRERWETARRPIQHLAPNQLPIWSNHEDRTWINMQTGESMSRRAYGADIQNT